MKTHLIAYLAGFIDADGYITVYRQRGPKRQDGRTPMYYTAKISATQATRTALDLLAKTFRGKVYRYENNGKYTASAGWFVWNCHGNEAVNAIKTLRPYLREKRKQADSVIRFHSLIAKQSQRPIRSLITPKMESQRDVLYMQLRHLNRPRNPKYRLETASTLDRPRDSLVT